jgi:hypothetical protein
MVMSCSFICGQGKNVNFWKDSWLGQPLKQTYPTLYSYALQQDMTIHQARVGDQWELYLDQGVSHRAMIEKQRLLNDLNGQSASAMNEEDELIWRWTANNKFGVKSFYEIMEGGPTISTMMHRIWEI